MPSAEIITIGTEILLGDILDTNARYLARTLRDAGIDLYRKTTVGDNARRIAQVIQEAMGRSDIILTTGGLGPTVDDPTREAVALATGVETEFKPELWDQIRDRFRRYGRLPTENNKRQAYIPKGAVAVENPVGTAPAFLVEIGEKCLLSLPGVPSEMEYLMQNKFLPYLRDHFHLTSTIKTRVIHTAGAGESQIDDLIGDLETLLNPTVGLAAHSGQVDVRITAKAESEEQVERLIDEVDKTVRQRLGTWIYGVDAETLEEVALRVLQARGWRLAVVEGGLGGNLIRRLAAVAGPFKGGEVLPEQPSPDELLSKTAGYLQACEAEVGLGVSIHPGPEKQEVYFVLITPLGTQQVKRSYGGPPEYTPLWALNHSLDLIRQINQAEKPAAGK